MVAREGDLPRSRCSASCSCSRATRLRVLATRSCGSRSLLYIVALGVSHSVLIPGHKKINALLLEMEQGPPPAGGPPPQVVADPGARQEAGRRGRDAQRHRRGDPGPDGLEAGRRLNVSARRATADPGGRPGLRRRAGSPCRASPSRRSPASPARTGGRRPGRSCTNSGSGSRKRVEVDDVDVAEHARARARRGRRGRRARRCRAVILLTTNSSGSRSCARSRAQCVSMNVGVLASQVVPQCAPPSPRPHAVVGCESISRTASREKSV